MNEPGRLTEQELAELSGTTTDLVRRLADCGVLRRRPDGPPFKPADVNRVRLIEALLREGVSLDELGRATAAGDLSFGYVDDLFPVPMVLLEQTADELAEELGLQFEQLRGMYAAWGLPAPVPGQRVREDDARTLAAQRAFPDQGLDADLLMQATRFFGDNLRRVAESQVGFFMSALVEPLLAAGEPPSKVLETVASVSAALQPAGRELVRWLHQRHFESLVMQQVVLILEETLERAGYVEGKPASPPAIAFMDLSGFTRLTEQAGDEAAAELASTLRDLVTETSQMYGGRVVKLLGDGVMFYFSAPTFAVACSVDLVERVAELGLPPARCGVQAGRVVYRDGDYFGRTVNVASRIVNYARPREVLVGEEVAGHPPPPGVVYREVGPTVLKGLREPVRVFRAARPRTVGGRHGGS
ncbi:MAG: adenylate/guanylate cyclase domain-containing protein [Actinomycetota bacterium]|nr:adenylate/guanylate cyclase domain-containing protein [Actinomycetota bacterium]